MKLEDYKQLHEAMEIPSQVLGSPFRDMLEKIFDEIVQMELEAIRGVNYVHRGGENSSKTNSYKAIGISKP